jgi:transaldolase
VSAEVVSTDYEGMVEEGRRLATIHERIVVKVPVSWDGLKAVRTLAADGVRVNVTLVFSAVQALLVAKAGAAYVSPFVGRLDDVGHEGLDVVRQTVAIYDNYDFETEVITASVRSPMHVIEAALAGADIATLPYSVLQQLVKHPLTDVGLERFLKDWRNWKEKQSGV